MSVKFTTDVKELKHFLPEVVDEIVGDLHTYLHLVSDIPAHLSKSDEMDYADVFWKSYGARLPGFVKLARYAFTIVTSSASAERAFSVLKRSFQAEQRLALEDYVMLSCMLQINRKDN
jgi:hAT family C-terminal dimerisation region